MLHTEGRQGGKKDTGALIVAFLLSALLLLAGCGETPSRQRRQLTQASFSSLHTEQYALDTRRVRQCLEHICLSDSDDSYAARRTKAYYRDGGVPLWVTYAGADSRADTLLAVLGRQLPRLGFSERPFALSTIRGDLERLRTLSFDRSGHGDADHVVARLDYSLTKAYLRYVAGQRFGFVNPDYVLNRYDASETDSTGRVLSYRHLFDVPMEHPGATFLAEALRQATPDSLSIVLSRAETSDSLYHRLLRLLPQASPARRRKLQVNIERRRWRETLPPAAAEKYVVVNVAAYHLWGVSADTVIDMRVACGAQRTKTPLLSSRFTHMEVNPEWVMPMSIVRDDVARHAGDSAYFARHRYYIADRQTGRRLSPQAVTAAMLCSGQYRVAQQGGAGNALGRIIFRFPNNFSVFLHDTSSPGAFGRDNRGVSHGCVRVQRPFDLAHFLMERDADEWLLDRLRISMGMKPETERGQDFLDSLDPAAPTPNLVRTVNIPSRVPIIITYYTIFQTPDGALQDYPDVYGYDEAIAQALAPYLL